MTAAPFVKLGTFGNDSETVKLPGGFVAKATVYPDPDHGPPWEEEDGHGPVSDWRDVGTKRAGERILCRDGDRARFYDFAEAVKIARRDGWGSLHPYELTTRKMRGGAWEATAGPLRATARDINKAIGRVYAARRASFPSARAYAANAAEADMKLLRDWCEDRWSYVGVAVTISKAGVELTGQYDHAIWGVESNAACGYLADLANEHLADALDAARVTAAALAEALR